MAFYVLMCHYSLMQCHHTVLMKPNVASSVDTGNVLCLDFCNVKADDFYACTYV